MKTFKSILLLAGVAAMLAACNKAAEPSVLQDAERYDVSVSVDGITLQTKSASVTPLESESKYNDAYILVFDADGALETYKPWDGGSVIFSLTAGKKTFVAVLNAGTDVTSVANLAALYQRTSSLADIKTKGFLMMGEKELTVTTSSDFAITVKRLAAKVYVDKINVLFDSPVLQSKSVKLKGVYLINVSAKNAYDASLSGEWINKMKFETSACDSLVAKRDYDKTLAQGQEYELAQVFYMMPNPTEDDFHNGEWKARHTRIVFELEVAGETYYYNKTFSSVIPNGLYSVNATKITKIGADTPDAEMDTSGAGGQITIDTWTPAGDYDETL